MRFAVLFAIIFQFYSFAEDHRPAGDLSSRALVSKVSPNSTIWKVIEASGKPVPTNLSEWTALLASFGDVLRVPTPFSDAPAPTDLTESRYLLTVDSPLLGGKLFVGIIPRADGKSDTEVISWNPESWKYDFGIQKDRELLEADTTRCFICHKTGGPLLRDFAWKLTPAVGPVRHALAARLEKTNKSLEGLVKRLEEIEKEVGMVGPSGAALSKTRDAAELLKKDPRFVLHGRHIADDIFGTDLAPLQRLIEKASDMTALSSIIRNKPPSERQADILLLTELAEKHQKKLEEFDQIDRKLTGDEMLNKRRPIQDAIEREIRVPLYFWLSKNEAAMDPFEKTHRGILRDSVGFEASFPVRKQDIEEVLALEDKVRHGGELYSPENLPSDRRAFVENTRDLGTGYLSSKALTGFTHGLDASRLRKEAKKTNHVNRAESCTFCHGSSAKGKMKFEVDPYNIVAFDAYLTANKNRVSFLRKVLQRVDNATMPPPDSEQATGFDFAKYLSELQNLLKKHTM